jgi:dipeptidyl aminopeptidase/acylaminoacyl peptidase
MVNMRHLVSAFSVVVATVGAGCGNPGPSTTKTESETVPATVDLAEYRAMFPTKLTRHGPPPRAWQSPGPLKLPSGVKEVTFQSGSLDLKGWLSQVPEDGQNHPAVVFCHGGFWFGNSDWDVLRPFIDEGFVVMAPRVRGENGNPGDFEYYYGEVDDVIAAGRFVAGLKGIDRSRIFVSGHSAGGDLATLSVMVDSPFAISAPIGATLDMRIMARATDDRHKQLVVFDPNDVHEVEARCAMLFTASLRSPIILFHGDRDWGGSLQTQFVNLARKSNRNATLVVVEGNHGQSLPNAIPKIIDAFRAYVPASSNGSK